jgi:hypothetical protein
MWRRNQEELAHRQYLEQLYRDQENMHGPHPPVQIIYHINPAKKPQDEEEKPLGDTEK